MQITIAKEIQDKFHAGLQIVGEDYEGNLEWCGTREQWEESDKSNVWKNWE